MIIEEFLDYNRTKGKEIHRNATKELRTEDRRRETVNGGRLTGDGERVRSSDCGLRSLPSGSFGLRSSDFEDPVFE